MIEVNYVSYICLQDSRRRSRVSSGYNAAMKLWPASYEEIEIPSRFGMTHVVGSGPKDAPPLVLLLGYADDVDT
jgi:hypothetical protein